jgi:hypothetical protein
MATDGAFLPGMSSAVAAKVNSNAEQHTRAVVVMVIGAAVRQSREGGDAGSYFSAWVT